MNKIYYRKIKNKEVNFMTGEIWTIEDVPLLWRDEVQAMLDGDGDEDGD